MGFWVVVKLDTRVLLGVSRVLLSTLLKHLKTKLKYISRSALIIHVYIYSKTDSVFYAQFLRELRLSRRYSLI